MGVSPVSSIALDDDTLTDDTNVPAQPESPEQSDDANNEDISNTSEDTEESEPEYPTKEIDMKPADNVTLSETGLDSIYNIVYWGNNKFDYDENFFQDITQVKPGEIFTGVIKISNKSSLRANILLGFTDGVVESIEDSRELMHVVTEEEKEKQQKAEDIMNGIDGSVSNEPTDNTDDSDNNEQQTDEIVELYADDNSQDSDNNNADDMPANGDEDIPEKENPSIVEDEDQEFSFSVTDTINREDALNAVFSDFLSHIDMKIKTEDETIVDTSMDKLLDKDNLVVARELMPNSDIELTFIVQVSEEIGNQYAMLDSGLTWVVSAEDIPDINPMGDVFKGLIVVVAIVIITGGVYVYVRKRREER